MGMNNSIHNSSKKSNNFQFVYSLILIILIPVLMILNTFFIWRSVKSNMDNELRRKAILSNEIISSLTESNVINNNTEIQRRLDELKKNSSEFEEISFITKSGDDFIVSSSTNSDKIDTIVEGYQARIAYDEKNPVAILGNYQSKVNNKIVRIWSVINPVEADGKIVGLFDTKVSLADIDELTRKSLQQSLIILILAIAITLLLLINHFRLFETAILAKKLEEVDKMKDDFISVASHELKTPVAVIRGYVAESLRHKDSIDKDQMLGNLSTIEVQVSRLNNLINDLLNVSRIEQKRMEFKAEPVNLSAIIKETIESLKDQIGTKQLILKYNQPDSDVIVLADNDRMREVFVNLISNAIKYSEKGEIEISHHIDKNVVQTFVKDTGIGMSAPQREHLFEKFYRVQTEKTTDIPGTGLGLWITRQMVERMKGKIFVDSMENVGTQFTVEMINFK